MNYKKVHVGPNISSPDWGAYTQIICYKLFLSNELICYYVSPLCY